MPHFNRTPKRRAEFIKPPNVLKDKAGYGGLSESILQKAQKLLEDNVQDFQPLGMLYLESLARSIENAKDWKDARDTEGTLTQMLYPAMQLKANGGMFGYQLVTQIADKLIQFLEVLDEPDIGAIEIIMAFHTAIRAVVSGRIMGDGGKDGKDLAQALDMACRRYFEHHPPVIDFE
ncbi:MAG: hypothetical protein IT559_01655 [Alphaproteobacteria bacterium]|nr:hypothetical protein [Alphaproteobacteria bacterium]